jgi:hypothetical protein
MDNRVMKTIDEFTGYHEELLEGPTIAWTGSVK